MSQVCHQYAAKLVEKEEREGRWLLNGATENKRGVYHDESMETSLGVTTNSALM